MSNKSKKEAEWTGSKWKHPYVIYVFATLSLFTFLLVMGFLAYYYNWLPAR